MSVMLDFMYRRAHKGVSGILTFVHTSYSGHARRFYDNNYHESAGHCESEAASATIEQHVRRIRNTVGRGRIAHVHEGTVRATRAIRVF